MMGTNADLGTNENECVSVVFFLVKVKRLAHMGVIVHADEIESCAARACPYLFYRCSTVGIKGMDMEIPHVFMIEHEIALNLSTKSQMEHWSDAYRGNCSELQESFYFSITPLPRHSNSYSIFSSALMPI
jgi:hypothetical protein